MKLFVATAAGALIIVFALFVSSWAFGAERCVAVSWYGTESGSRTATGEYFDGRSLTAAMPSRSELGRRYRVTYGRKSVVVRINDIGPAAWTGRGVDLSRAAAVAIELLRAGHGKVCLERVD